VEDQGIDTAFIKPQHMDVETLLVWAVQVDPMRPELKAPETNLLTFKCDVPLSSFAFNVNLRRYILTAAAKADDHHKVGRCRLTLSNPC
jgi:hypothetical protein